MRLFGSTDVDHTFSSFMVGNSFRNFKSVAPVLGNIKNLALPSRPATPARIHKVASLDFLLLQRPVYLQVVYNLSRDVLFCYLIQREDYWQLKAMHGHRSTIKHGGTGPSRCDMTTLAARPIDPLQLAGATNERLASRSLHCSSIGHYLRSKQASIVPCQP
jgi:hypothetical protein